jgi:hypothetical protein
LFRAVAKAVTPRAEQPKPKTRRRRRGEDTHDLFLRAWRMATIRTRIAAYTAASIFMSETLDWLHWQHGYTASSSEPDSAANTVGNHLSPNP